MDWYIQPEQQRRYFTLFDGITATRGVLPDRAQWPRLYRWRSILAESSTFMPTDQVFVNSLMDSWFQVQDNVVAGRISPSEAARQLEGFADARRGKR